MMLKAWHTCIWGVSPIQKLVPKLLLHFLGCVLRVVVLLEGEPSPQSEVLRALEQVFINNLSVLCGVHHSFDLD